MSTGLPVDQEYQREHAYQSNVPSIIAAYAVNTLLAYTAVALRLYARKVSAAGFGWDDGLVIGSLVFYSAYVVCAAFQTAAGAGTHLKNPTMFAKAWLSTLPFYAAGITMVKASVLCFYCRIFYSRRLARVCWAFGIFIFLYNLASIIVDLVHCVPLSALWTGQKAKCFGVALPFMILGTINALTDFLLLAIPLRKISKLQLARKRRIQLYGIFTLGGAVAVFGVVRVVMHTQMIDKNIGVTTTWPGIWSCCELAMGIVCACLPTLAGLAKKIRIASQAKSLLRYNRDQSSSSCESQRTKDPVAMAESGCSQFDGAPPPMTRSTRVPCTWIDAHQQRPEKQSAFKSTTALNCGDRDDEDNDDVTESSSVDEDMERQGKITMQFEIEQSIHHE